MILMPLGSSLLIFHQMEPVPPGAPGHDPSKDPRYTCGRVNMGPANGKPIWYDMEDSAGCFSSTSLNSGMNLLWWRWNDANSLTDGGGLGSSQAQAVLKLLLSRYSGSSNGHYCVILEQNFTLPGWPRCNVDLDIPMYAPTGTCSLGHVGPSYKFKNDVFTGAIPTACRSCDTGTCAGEASLLDQCLV